MKKKLLFVSEALWIGGIETALVNLLNALDYEKYEVTCLVLRAELDLADRITSRCRLLVADRENRGSFSEPYRFRRLYHLTEESANPSRLHRCLLWAVPAVKWLENRLYIRYIRRQLRGEHFDTCIIYSDRTAEAAVRAVNAERFLMFYHHGAMRRVYHDEIGYKRAEKVIAVSSGLAEKLKEFRPKYADKILSIPNLVDAEWIRRKSAESISDMFEENRFQIVSCGRLAPEKGMDLAVEAAEELIRMGRRDFRWWIVGSGPEEHNLRRKIVERNLDEFVTMTGMKKNPYPYIKRADLYVQPSRVEAYGLTIAEALVLGKSVIATDTDGAREIFCNTRRGELCEINKDAIATAVAYAMSGEEDVPITCFADNAYNEPQLRLLEKIL